MEATPNRPLTRPPDLQPVAGRAFLVFPYGVRSMTTMATDRRFILASVRAMANAGHSSAFIAQKLGVSVGTVQTLLNVLALPIDAQEAFAGYKLTCSAVQSLTRARKAGTLAATWDRLQAAKCLHRIQVNPPAIAEPPARPATDLQPRYLIVRRMVRTSNPIVRDTLAWVLCMQPDPPA